MIASVPLYSSFQPLVLRLIVTGPVMTNYWLSVSAAILQKHCCPSPPPALTWHKFLGSGGIHLVSIGSHQCHTVGIEVQTVVGLENKATQLYGPDHINLACGINQKDRQAVLCSLW